MAEEIAFAEDLAATRAAHGLSQGQMAELMGYRRDTLGKMERGAKPPTGPAMKKLRAVKRRLAAAAETAAGAGAEPPADGGSGDLPPIAEPPPAAEPPEEDAGLDSILHMGAGGRSVSVRSLGHFQRIELSFYVFLVGKEIEYTVPTPGGKAERSSVHQMGIADLLPPADAAVIRDSAAELAHAWVEWAKVSPRVNTFLSFLIVEGGAKGVMVSTGKVVFLLLRNHGIDPLSWILQPLREEQVPGFGVPFPVEDGDHPPHPGDGPPAGGNGAGGLGDLGPYGFGTVEGGTGLDGPRPEG